MFTNPITLTAGPYPTTLDGLSQASRTKDLVRLMIHNETTPEQHGNAVIEEIKIANSLLYAHGQDYLPWVGELSSRIEENFRLVRGDVNLINIRLVKLERWHLQSQNRKSCKAPFAKDLVEIPNISGQIPSEFAPPLQALTSTEQLSSLDTRELRRYLAFYSINYSTSDPSLNKIKLYKELGVPLE